MAVLVICLFLALAAGLVAIYARISPLQAVQDKATAYQGAQEGQRKARATEGEELLKGLRNQIKELVATIHLERGTANERQDQLQEERAAWEAYRAQLSAERSTSEGLCAQHNRARIALEKLCLELYAERVNLLDYLYGAFGPARVNHAVATIKAACERAEQERAPEDETKPEGIPTRRAAPDRQRPASVELEPAQGERPAARAAQAPLERARDTTLPTTREDHEKQRELLAATATGDVDVDDATAHASSKAALATASEAGAGGATLSPQGAPRALHAGAVAPPASASMPLASEPASKAAGLGEKPEGPHGARPPVRSTGTRTMTGMPAMRPPPPGEGIVPERSTRTPTWSAPRDPISTPAPVAPTSASSTVATSFFGSETEEEREITRDTETGAPPRAPKPGNDDGEPTEIIEIGPEALQRALRPAVQEGLRGIDGVPEAASGHPLSPTQETPRKSRMKVLEAGK